MHGTRLDRRQCATTVTEEFMKAQVPHLQRRSSQQRRSLCRERMQPPGLGMGQ